MVYLPSGTILDFEIKGEIKDIHVYGENHLQIRFENGDTINYKNMPFFYKEINTR